MKFAEFMSRMYYGTQFDIRIVNEHKIFKDITPRHIFRNIEYREYYDYEVLSYGTRWSNDERKKEIFVIDIIKNKE